MIKAKNLSYVYPENYEVLCDLNFTMNEGEFWGVFGKNGAGKTTLIDLIIGFKSPTEGKIVVGGDSSKNRSFNPLDEIVFISQDVNLKGDISIREYFDFHSVFYSSYSKSLEEELIRYFELDETSLIGSLSTGQQKKVQVVSGLASDTKIIVIDEITAVLDPETRHRFFKKIVQFNKEKRKTIVLATNISEDLSGITDKILFIKERKGEVLLPAALDTIFTIDE